MSDQAGAQAAALVRDAHYARVTPVVGEDLRRARVAVLGGAPLAAQVVELLAACGVGRWVWCARDDAGAATRGRLVARHGGALGLDLRAIDRPGLARQIDSGELDLLIAAGDRADLLGAAALLERGPIPALLVAQRGADEIGAWVHLPGDDPGGLRRWAAQAPTAPAHAVGADHDAHTWAGACAAPLLAGVARALLQRGTPFRRADLEHLWERGARSVDLGGAHPFAVAWGDGREVGVRRAEAIGVRFRTPAARRGRVLVAGLGSIGSVAAALIAPWAERLSLADPDCVDATNPARQQYALADIGRAKADALRDRLADRCPQIEALPERLTEEARVSNLIGQHGITAALVATGTDADFAIARALRAAGVPHVVARCYPRARYWEAALVDGARGPSFEQVRGHLRVGPAAPPTAEQVAAYSDAGALEAEPATLVESGWAAAWAARLTHQLLTPPGLRERWALELLAAGQICLVGGVGVEPTESGPAYGVALPGQIHAWGLAQVGDRDPALG